MLDIKLLSEDQVDEYRVLRLQALLNAPESFGSAYEEECTLQTQEWREGLARETIFGAYNNEKLVGVIGFYVLSKLKSKHCGVVFGLYVTPDFRGQGIADKLMERVIVHARTTVLQLHLSCVLESHNALALYKKHGFKTYGTEPSTLLVNDKYYDVELMVLDLRGR